MTLEPDPFQRLSRLMALKRHEQPPPGYFEHFSDRVIARIEAEQLARSLPWWERMLSPFTLKPALVGACGLMLTAGILTGVLFTGPGVGTAQPMLSSLSQVGDEGPHTMIAMEQKMPSSTEPVPSSMPSYNPFNQPLGGVTRVSFNY